VNYYELIYLNKELNVKLRSETLHRIISPQKNLVELFIGEYCLRFHAVPPTPYIYVRNWNSAKKKNVINFFPDLYDQTVKDIISLTQERYLGIHLSGGAVLWFEVFGSQANLYLEFKGELLDSFKTCKPSLKSAEQRWKKAVEQHNISSKSTELFDAVNHAIQKAITEDVLSNEENSNKEVEKKNLKKNLCLLNPSIERTHLEELIRIHLPESTSLKNLQIFALECHEQLAYQAEFRLLSDGSRTLFPEDFLPKQTKETFQSISDLIVRHSSNLQREGRYKQLLRMSQKELDKAIKKTRVNITQLEKAVDNEEKATFWEECGHILMTKAHVNKPVSDVLITQNYFRNNEEVKIKLDVDQSFVENAQRYYKKASNAKRSIEVVQQQLPLISRRLERLLSEREWLESLHDIRELDSWRRKMVEKGLLNIQPSQASTANSNGIKRSAHATQSNIKNQHSNHATSKPYHECSVSGFFVWIGKNARSNDKLLSLAHKEDIWLHAKSVSGSHVIIRAQQKKPSKSVVEIAASFAAHQSKAKGSEWVPVIYTPKKYVRKAKNAPPGAVIVQKEQVIMVEPLEPRNIP
jgi:predicted ribosome quality control (RQC) complex YloA/Tae2 family protein